MAPSRFFSAALAVLLLSSFVGLAQQVAILPRTHEAPAKRADVPRADIRVDSSLVLIPAHVTNASGTSVTSLSREEFHLFEDGVEQKITTFAKDDAPISIGLLFDASGSMQKKMQKSSEAAAAFFKTANLEDEFFLVEFNERPKLAVPFTPDSMEIYKRISHTKPFGRTSLLDAIHMALEQMKFARNLRKAIVILSDGGDNRSRYTVRQIKSAMLESDVQVYAMGIFDRDATHRLPSEEVNGPHLLDELSQETGGQHYPVDNLDDLSMISERIGMELRMQYMLGYSSTNAARDGKYRRVKLTLTPPADMTDLHSYYRQGYYAPSN